MKSNQMIGNADKELQTIRRAVRSLTRKGYSITSLDEDDLVQECFCHFMAYKKRDGQYHNLFEEFDETKGNYYSLIYLSTRNYLQNMSKRDKIRPMSLNNVTYSEDGNTVEFQDYIGDDRIDIEASVIEAEVQEPSLQQILANHLSDADYSPSYRLTPRELFNLVFVEELSAKDVSKKITYVRKGEVKNLSLGRVQQLIRSLKDDLQDIATDLGYAV